MLARGKAVSAAAAAAAAAALASAAAAVTSDAPSFVASIGRTPVVGLLVPVAA